MSCYQTNTNKEDEVQMKILAFNGSPRMKRSNTDQILQPFLEGARQAGAETERELNDPG